MAFVRLLMPGLSVALGLLMMKDSGAIEEMQRLLCLCVLGGGC